VPLEIKHPHIFLQDAININSLCTGSDTSVTYDYYRHNKFSIEGSLKTPGDTPGAKDNLMFKSSGIAKLKAEVSSAPYFIAGQ
jgi:hypothetical protein